MAVIISTSGAMESGKKKTDESVESAGMEGSPKPTDDTETGDVGEKMGNLSENPGKNSNKPKESPISDPTASVATNVSTSAKSNATTSAGVGLDHSHHGPASSPIDARDHRGFWLDFALLTNKAGRELRRSRVIDEESWSRRFFFSVKTG